MNSKLIPLGTLITLITTLVTILVGGTVVVMKFDARLVAIERVIANAIGPLGDRWTGADMRQWRALLQATNPELDVPEVVPMRQ